MEEGDYISFYNYALTHLDNCYLSSRVPVGNFDSGYDIEHEFFLVAGEDAVIRVNQYDIGSAKIIFNGIVYPARIPYPDRDSLDEMSFDEISELLTTGYNELRKKVMMLEYCVKKLRGMSYKAAINSPLYDKKCRLEYEIITQDYVHLDKNTSSVVVANDTGFLDLKIMKKLQKRCDELTVKMALDNGTISAEYAYQLQSARHLDFAGGKAKQRKFAGVIVPGFDLFDPCEVLGDYDVPNDCRMEDEDRYAEDVEKLDGFMAEYMDDPLTFAKDEEYTEKLERVACRVLNFPSEELCKKKNAEQSDGKDDDDDDFSLFDDGKNNER